MKLKWSKKICIEKITESPQLPSHFEELNKTNGGVSPEAIQAVRQAIQKRQKG